MSAQRDPQSSVSPWVQAQRAEQAARGELVVSALVNADLAAADLPPEGIALVGGDEASADWAAALRVAAWLADVMQGAGLSKAAAALYDAQRDRVPSPGSHAWRARALASRVLARRVLSAAAVDVAAYLEEVEREEQKANDAGRAEGARGAAESTSAGGREPRAGGGA